MNFITEYADAFWSMTYDVGQIAKVVFAWGLTFLAVFFVGVFLGAICSIIKDKFTKMKTLKTSSEYCRKNDKPIIEVDDRDRQKCLNSCCIYCDYLDRKENIYGK